jgi:hypothetical protein
MDPSTLLGGRRRAWSQTSGAYGRWAANQTTQQPAVQVFVEFRRPAAWLQIWMRAQSWTRTRETNNLASAENTAILNLADSGTVFFAALRTMRLGVAICAVLQHHWHVGATRQWLNGTEQCQSPSSSEVLPPVQSPSSSEVLPPGYSGTACLNSKGAEEVGGCNRVFLLQKNRKRNVVLWMWIFYVQKRSEGTSC